MDSARRQQKVETALRTPRSPAGRAAARDGVRGTSPPSSGRASNRGQRCDDLIVVERRVRPGRGRSARARGRTRPSRENPSGVKWRAQLLDLRVSGTPTRRRDGRRSAVRGCRGSTRRVEEICCVVIATTSASNGFGFIVGRNPHRLDHQLQRRVAGRPARRTHRDRCETEQPRDLAAASSLQGSMATPPSTGVIRTSQPPTTRCSPLVPHRRAVGAEVAEAGRRELEVVRRRIGSSIRRRQPPTSASSGRAARISIA